MITEQQREVVQTEIIDQMTSMFNAPYGSDDRKMAIGLSNYVEQLAQYPRDVLAAAWVAIVRGYGGRNWPSLKTIIEHCDSANAARSVGGGAKRSEWRKGFWLEVEKRAKDYTERFMTGVLAQEAASEGYATDLRDWVRGVARYQAQIVVRCQRQGHVVSADVWNGTEGYPRHLYDGYQLDEMVKEQDIAVSLPAAVLKDFRLRIATRERMAQEKLASAARGLSIGKAARRALPPPAPETPAEGPLGPEPPMPDSEYDEALGF